MHGTIRPAIGQEVRTNTGAAIVGVDPETGVDVVTIRHGTVLTVVDVADDDAGAIVTDRKNRRMLVPWAALAAQPDRQLKRDTTATLFACLGAGCPGCSACDPMRPTDEGTYL